MQPQYYALLAAFIGALTGGAISLIATWLNYRNQQALERSKAEQALRHHKADKVYQLAVDAAAAAYSFLSITWTAIHEGKLSEKELNEYFNDMQKHMPRLFAHWAILAGLDDQLGKVASNLVTKADFLDQGIGAAAPDAERADINKLRALRKQAEEFRDYVRYEFVDAMIRISGTARAETVSAK